MKVSIILPLMDEVVSLRKTCEIVLGENAEVSEVLIVVCPRTTPDALATAAELAREYPGVILVREQHRPRLGGAIRDAFEWTTGSHVVMMASDLETDPYSVKDLIAKAREGWDIVTATRWKGSGGFQGYSRIKFYANWIFQKMFGLLYLTSLSDLTYGYRIFKAEWVKNVRWEETGHPFLLETVLKPLRLGARVVEIPSTWIARTEGESHNPFLRNFIYFRIAIQTRLRSRQRFWRTGPESGMQTPSQVPTAAGSTETTK